MNSDHTISFTLPNWKVYLLISLFNADGGDGYTDEEIAKADEFIATHGLQHFISTEDLDGDNMQCSFHYTPPDDNCFWALISEENKRQYMEYGQLPYTPQQCEQENSIFYCGDIISTMRKNYPDAVFVKNLRQKLHVWWKAQPDKITRIFSVYPSAEESWKRTSLATQQDIYRYCIAKENNLPLSPVLESSFIKDISYDLSILAMEMLNPKPLSQMADNYGKFIDDYEKQNDRVYKDIKRLISSLDFSKQ